MSYWDLTLARRINRRRALAATGATALGTALLAACGGGGDDGAAQDAAGLLSRNVDTSKDGVPGGTAFTQITRDPPHLNSLAVSGTADNNAMQNLYERLLWRLPSPDLDGRAGAFSGAAAESFELSPDGLSLTLKLRGNKFDERAPTNGRAMTSQDVMFSWEQFKATSVFAADINGLVNNSGQVMSVSAPDAKTLVFKLGYPSRSILSYLSHASYFSILPVEAEDKFDPKKEAHGSGPFYLEKWAPSVNFTFKKNPNWWMKNRPFLDGYVQTVMPEYATAMAQLESGTLWNFEVRQEDILRLKRDHPTMVLRQSYDLLGGAGSNGAYNVLSQQDNSFMKDVRFRRATSMLVDRDAWIDVYYNTGEFKDAGLPVSASWNSCISAGFDECLKPNVPELAKKLGEGAKYYQHDIAEAKKLIAATGYSGQPIGYFVDNTPDRQKINQILMGMFQEGFNINYRVLDYNTEFREICQRGGGKLHDGLCYTTASGLTAEIYLTSVFLPEGKFGAWRGNDKPYPELDAMVRKMRTETDEQRQLQMIYDIQGWGALNMPHLFNPGSSPAFTLNWPWMENFGLSAFIDYITDEHPFWWYNKSKDPKAKQS